MASELTHFRVFAAIYVCGVRDDHFHIFVLTEKKGEQKGLTFRPTGNIQEGMAFEKKDDQCPPNPSSFMCMQQFVWVLHKDLDLLESIVLSIQPPAEQFNGRERFPLDPIRNYQHWTALAIEALRESATIVPLSLGDSGMRISRRGDGDLVVTGVGNDEQLNRA